MKNLKKIMALVLVGVMIMLMGTVAWAAEGAPADTSISVSGLDADDTVNFYQVLKFDETANETGGWVNGTGFTLTVEQIKKILGIGDYAEGGEKADEAGIDAELAGEIAVMAQTADAKFENVSVSSGAATAATTDVGTAGLYVALVTPGTADNLYNPVFVAADYTAGGSNTQAAVTTLSYSPEALAKKENITLTKEVTGEQDTKYDVNVGDSIPFTITTKVPAYSDAYQNPTFEITDTLKTGLAFDATVTPTVTMAGLTGDNALAAADYELNTDANPITFTMKPSGLEKVAKTGTAQTIVITYNAKITSLDEGNVTVTEKTNEATVKFSNNPDDSTSYSLLEDKTRNYTFSLDANLLGKTGTSYETDELIKVGLKADGTPATETMKYHSGTTWTELSPLSGAKFALFKESPAAADYASEEAAKASSKIYTNTVETDGIIESDANGRLNIQGLDAGTYYLREVSAPSGYIADNRTFTITIAAEYDTIEGGTYNKTVDEDTVLVKYDAYKVLKSYTVTVNDGENNVTSSYTIEKTGAIDHQVVDKATYQTITGDGAGEFAGDVVTPISNTQGTALPSTGGVGTTIFYIVGAVLVLGAGILLVTKKRVHG